MKVMRPSASIQEPTVRIYVNFIFSFQSTVFGPNKCKQISMTSSRRFHTFTGSNLLPSLTTSFRRRRLCIFGDAILVVQTILLELICTK